MPLAPVRDAGEIPATVLAALGIPELVWVADARRPLAPPPLDRLADALASRRLLLVLDNCEHVIDGGGPAGRPGAGRLRPASASWPPAGSRSA